MKTRSLNPVASAVALVWCFASLIACATANEGPASEPDGGQDMPPPVDAGSDSVRDDDGAAADPCTPDAFCPNGPFDCSGAEGRFDPRTRVTVVRGRAPDDVWAAGALGAIAHFDGSKWTCTSTGANETIRALWLRDAGELALGSHVFARGLPPLADAGPPTDDGWTAASLSKPPNMLSSWTFTSGWMTASAEWLWYTTLEFPSNAANGIGRLHFDPATSSLVAGSVGSRNLCATFGCRQMMSIHGTSAVDLWAVGLRGAIIHITRAQSDTPVVKPFDSQAWTALEGVWVASDKDAWAVGGGGVIRHYTGNPLSWDIVSDVPTNETLHAVWGTSSEDIWAVGDAAVILHYDGIRWSQVRVGGLGGRRPDLYTVWTSAPDHVWIGGDGVVLAPGGKP